MAPTDGESAMRYDKKVNQIVDIDESQDDDNDVIFDQQKWRNRQYIRLDILQKTFVKINL